MASMSVRVDPRALPVARGKMRRRLWNDRYLYLLVLPGLLYYLVYRYVPMVGIVIAFEDYNPFQGFLGSPWVGLEYFERIFSDPEVWSVLSNTFILSFLQIFFAFPAPILLALMLNEVRSQVYKQFIQATVYLPHFFSWVVVISIAFTFLRHDGFINNLMKSYGFQPIDFIVNPAYFRPLVILEVIWKETGWGTILFLAALAGVNLDLYEAAALDGANRLQVIWAITLPQIRSVVVILLILRLGNVLESGFEQIFIMQNSVNLDTSNVLDTFVYYKGIQQGDFSFATAVGLLKGLVGLVLVVGSNQLAKRAGETGIY